MERVLQNVRLSFVKVWDPEPNPSGLLKYGAMLLIDKDDKPLVREVAKAIEDARQEALDSGKVKNKKLAQSAQTPLRDIDEEREMGKKFAQNMENYYFVNANNDDPPNVVDQRGQPILDQSEIYSGVICHVAASFYYTDKGGSPKICVGLNHLMKVADADRLDGRSSPIQAFSEFLVAEEDEPGEGELE
jgi:hypothetical protein